MMTSDFFRFLRISLIHCKLARTHTTPSRNANCDGVVFMYIGTVMVEKYNKPHLTFGDQAAQLQLRGLIINNPGDCIGTLEKIGYYRLPDVLVSVPKDKTKSVANNSVQL
ncbi:hypothetical protein FRC0259_01855 [Corynebacterium diphtheriae]|nr:hypothetical protein CIP107508_00640 [Corynebacterium diphtheriae]CAB0611102.1 hypothetical protein CIP107552_01815 [Corynebacterium diphtheriae]CAB0611128.1 hypothetical protein CIP107559_01795 [Corynebacterium diphtheriae]CAB0614394.1 hypothetical protein CIP107557_01809 [Corynebacterium diphtheriae]CAB0811750.1 hypothetical protein FRC0259_01855 [Corynebacterium diphtheriae]